jgi:hypothetical protein
MMFRNAHDDPSRSASVPAPGIRTGSSVPHVDPSNAKMTPEILGRLTEYLLQPGRSGIAPLTNLEGFS